MRIVNPIGMFWPACRPPGGSGSSLVTAPSLANAVPASAPSARRVPIAMIPKRRMHSSAGGCMALAPLSLLYNRGRPGFPGGSLAGGGRGDELPTARDPHEKEEQQECERDVDREHREDAAIAESRKEE